MFNSDGGRVGAAGIDPEAGLATEADVGDGVESPDVLEDLGAEETAVWGAMTSRQRERGTVSGVEGMPCGAHVLELNEVWLGQDWRNYWWSERGCSMAWYESDRNVPIVAPGAKKRGMTRSDNHGSGRYRCRNILPDRQRSNQVL